MNSTLSCWTRRLMLLSLLAAVATVALAQAPAPSTPPTTPATSPTPVPGIRNKLSAGDLPSAESIAEVWRTQHGQDGPWLVGYSWLARGALMLGEREKARAYSDSTLALCAQRRAAGADLAHDAELETALGAAMEVHAQLLATQRDARTAAEYLRRELKSLPGPVALRSRLWKRINLLTLAGQPAPELVAEGAAGSPAPSLVAMRGKPVVLFLFNHGCGDCRSMAPTLARIRDRHAGAGLQVVALTRYYDDEAKRATEKAALDSTWSATYAAMGTTPVVVSTASMERFGGSSTPTFVFIDRSGIVRGYVATRLTEAEFEKALSAILR
jgi:thiol-disulfide isomerase/thioredoxin